uniref:Kinesin motor domain-containing protein n=1 Tax=Mucochytrium quahogii TaxID=96639 RepID=A0A7S2SJP8_9STRA|mmetsp:Transcript_1563/g.2367  ORF Transcript_1563/g.2367 Transcript_1563/m.2367 type:complete len:612 (+) Transcript_1563:347-2182(+)
MGKLVVEFSSASQPWVMEMLGFLTFKDRAALMRVNRAWSNISSGSKEVWFRNLCLYASYEFQVYVPNSLWNGGSWEEYFQEIWSLRNIWHGSTTDEPDIPLLQNNKIQVFAKFKPFNENESTKHDDSEDDSPRTERVVLPFHQRMSLLRASTKKKLGNKEAIRILQKQGEWWGGKEFNEQGEVVETTEESCVAETQEEQKSAKQGFKFAVHSVNEATGQVVVTAPNIGLRDFQYNFVFNPHIPQEETYTRTGKKLVIDVLNGYNGTLFVYGQTGSGKTYTMFGPDDEAACGNAGKDDGLVPRICHDVFASLKHRRETQSIDGTLSVSYIEIYGDQVFDLLRNGARVGHSRVAAQRFVLEGEAKVPVEDEKTVYDLLVKGEACKTKAATKMNERSTRAHTLLVLSISQKCLKLNTQVDSVLFLADLGGSERIAKSDAQGQQRAETININMGLLALKQVITALNNKQRHVPYHDSKLTMLLSSGLGGKSRTQVLICMHSDPAHAAETLQTLRFGEECSLVKTKRGNNVSIVISMVEEIDRKIEALKEEIRIKERWETVETRRSDVLVETGTIEEAIASQGGETIRTTRLVGAEAEHEHLEALYEQRAHLLGYS